MNATDLSCIENLSANVGKRGARGITGAKGVPGTYSAVVGPTGQPGAPGKSRIDIAFRSEAGPVAIANVNFTTAVSYIIFPGTVAWEGLIQKIKVACSIDMSKQPLDGSVKVLIDVEDITLPLTPVSILSAPLEYTREASSSLGNTIYNIVQNGTGDNLYTTINSSNLPSLESMLRVSVTVESEARAKAYIHAIEIT